MAIVSEIQSAVALGKDVVNLVTALWGNRRKAEEMIERFQEKEQEVNRKLAMWRGIVAEHGNAEVDAYMAPVLDEATIALEREKAQLAELQSLCWLCRFLKINLRPPADQDQAFGNIDRIIQAIENIPEEMRKRDEVADFLARRTLRGLRFSKDHKYVPPQRTLSLLLDALESHHQNLSNHTINESNANVDVGGRVIALHGGPGSGKTALAKYVALLYQEKRDEQRTLMGAASITKSQDSPLDHQQLKASTSTKPKEMFKDGVCFLACGQGAKVHDKLEDLRQCLSLSQDPNDATSHDKTYFQTRLMARLLKLSCLIILDDVWEQDFIEAFIMPGKGLRFLVTTQNRSVCNQYGDATYISIEKPDPLEARKILASHVKGLHEIPQHLQEIADSIIEKTDFHPLSLANLAANISPTRPAAIEEWRNTRKDLLGLLNDLAKVAGVFDESYTMTVTASMLMVVKTLGERALTLLLLVAYSEGPTIQEEVLKVWYEAINGTLSLFARWLLYLEDRNCIELQTINASGNSDGYTRAWSMHKLRKHFIKLDPENKQKLQGLVGPFDHDSKLSLARALWSLYGAVDANLKPNDAGSSHKEMSQTRSLVEPFVMLLNSDAENIEMKNAHSLASQVIVGFVFGTPKSEVNTKAICGLLKLHNTNIKASIAACCGWKKIVLYHVYLKGEALIIRQEDIQLMANSLVEFLSIDAVKAAEALGVLVVGSSLINEHIDFNDSWVFKKLLGLLTSQNTKENISGALAVGYLAITCSKSIVNAEGLIDVLWKLLEKGEDRSVPDGLVCSRSAAFALGGLALAEGNRASIMRFKGAIEKMVDCIRMRGESPDESDVGIELRAAITKLAEAAKTQYLDVVQDWTAQNVAKISSGSIDGVLILVGEELVKSLSSKTIIGGDSDASTTLLSKIKKDPHMLLRVAMLLDDDQKRSILMRCQEVWDGIAQVLSTEIAIRDLSQYSYHEYNNKDHLHKCAAKLLTISCPSKANNIPLNGVAALHGRAEANMLNRHNSKALDDLNKALQVSPFPAHAEARILSHRSYVKAMLRDYNGALQDLNLALLNHPSQWWLYVERGILEGLLWDKMKMPNMLSKALEDFTKAIEMEEKAKKDYDLVMHLGHVKHLMGNENDARVDAEPAQSCLKTNNVIGFRMMKPEYTSSDGDKFFNTRKE